MIAKWTESEWRAFWWRLHLALRRVFTDCGNGIGSEQLAYLKGIQEKLLRGDKFNIADCPEELRGGQKRDAAQAGLGPEKAAGSDDQKKKATTNKPPTSSPIADNFKTLVENAKEASKDKKRFTLGKVLPKPADYAYVFGEDFLKVVEGEPCGHFLLYRCTRGEQCKFSHALKKQPEKPVIAGAVKRFQEKVDAYVAAEASKG